MEEVATIDSHIAVQFMKLVVEKLQRYDES
jgi:hypothetical protein